MFISYRYEILLYFVTILICFALYIYIKKTWKIRQNLFIYSKGKTRGKKLLEVKGSINNMNN